MVACTCGSGRNNRPLRSKNGPPSGRRTLWNSAGLLRQRRRQAARPHPRPSSGVAPSITTIVSLCKRRERALVGELALPPLVLGRDQLGRVGGHGEMTGGIDQRPAVRPRERSSTRNGCRAVAATTRPIHEVIINSCGRASACAASRGRSSAPSDRGDDMRRVEPGLVVLLGLAVVIDEAVGQRHGTELQAAVEQAAPREMLHHQRSEPARGTFLDRHQHGVLAREALDQRARRAAWRSVHPPRCTRMPRAASSSAAARHSCKRVP